MTVRLLVGANGKLRNMRGHGSIGELQHDVLARRATLLPFLQRKIPRIGDEIRVPHPAWIGFSLAAEIFRIAIESIGEIARRIEDEVRARTKVEDDRHAIDGKKPRRLIARAVEMLVSAIKRQSKQAAVVPLKRLFSALVVPNRGGASPLEHEMQILVQMLHGVELLAGEDFTHV